MICGIVAEREAALASGNDSPLTKGSTISNAFGNDPKIRQTGNPLLQLQAIDSAVICDLYSNCSTHGTNAHPAQPGGYLMKRFVCLVAVLAVLALAPSAHATMQLVYQINGGTVTVCNTGPDAGPVLCPTISQSGVAVTFFSGLSNSPGTPANAQEFSSTLDISNTSGSAATVVLWVSAQNWTQPTAPPGSLLWSNEQSLDGTLGTTTGNALDCLDANNAGEPGGIGTSTPTYCTAGMTLDNVAQTITGSSSASHTTTMLVPTLTAPYAMSTQITLNMAAGAEMHFQDSQILAQTPEPLSLALLGGVLLLTSRALRRKKSQISA